MTPDHKPTKTSRPPKIIVCFGGDCREYVWMGYQYVAVAK